MPPPPISPLPAAEPVAGVAAMGRRQRRRGLPGPIAAAEAPAVPPPRAASGNPSLRLDPGLGLVIIEFHNATGTVTHTIPTAQQLQAYRRWQSAAVGPTGTDAARQSAGDAPGAPTPTVVPGPGRTVAVPAAPVAAPGSAAAPALPAATVAGASRGFTP